MPLGLAISRKLSIIGTALPHLSAVVFYPPLAYLTPLALAVDSSGGTFLRCAKYHLTTQQRRSRIGHSIDEALAMTLLGHDVP